jgi:pSer/pThr/pTyr-binding forkhead associated (FHA) protein
MKAELVPENGDPPIPVVRDLTIVGRREYCDVVIDHHSLSKRHCLLVKTDGLLVIRDLATTNGTKVKGQKVRWAALLPDDRISFGAYKVRVYLGPDDMPAPSEQGKGRGRASGAGSAPRPAAPAISPWPRDADPVAPGVPMAFPEPSRSQVSTFSPPNLASAPAPSPAAGRSALEDDFQFEILDDDDDIIDLD